MDCSPPGSPVHGILQQVGCHALLQEIFPTQGLHPCLPWQVGSLHSHPMDRGAWEGATSIGLQRVRQDWSNLAHTHCLGSPRKVYVLCLVAQSCPTLCDPMDCSPQSPLSMGILHGQEWVHEYWSGLPYPSPWYLPDPGVTPRSPALQADSLLSESPGKSIKVYTCV